ncbi:MAG: hypothetical protein C0594_03875 [Marinilabiliales bacterium]|nr:MAG: hypothetical protein C0594_03875 [Marinilabiliales bacterium]
MKFIISVLFSLLWILPLYAQENTEFLKIDKVKISKKILSKNISGIKLELTSKLVYDKSKYKLEKPKNASIKLYLRKPDGDTIQAIKASSNYKDYNGYFAASKSITTIKTEVFIPYYALKLSEGEHKLEYCLSAFVRDTSINQPQREISVKGEQTGEILIQKPPVENFKLVVRGVRVTKKDFKNKEWDWGLSGKEPDIKIKVLLINDYLADIVFSSTTMKNSFSAAWIDYSEPITISKGDKITIGVYDDDIMFDDKMGTITHSLPEFLKIANNIEELSFNLVTFFLLDIKKENSK